MKKGKILISTVAITCLLNVTYGDTSSFGIPLVNPLKFIKFKQPEVIKNLTPEVVTQNPSDRYTIKMMPALKAFNVDRESYQAWIVIDEERHPMRLADKETHTFVYEYIMPKGRNAARYYFDLNYKIVNAGNQLKDRTAQSKLYELDLTNRYVISMESERGRVGSKIAVVGRGFQEGDKILVNDVAAETFYESPNALEFEIPALEAEQSYKVGLSCSGNVLPVGELYVDSSELGVNLDNIQLHPKEKVELVFSLPEEAPGKGLELNILTDVPMSVVMPDVSIQGGARSVSVTVEGGEPGEGSLYISAAGYKEKVIPISVL